MANYGNILTFINSDQTNKDKVEIILTNLEVKYVFFNELYFLQSTSKLNTRNIIKELELLPVEFLFYHNHISDGSQIKSKDIDSEIIDKIKDVLIH